MTILSTTSSDCRTRLALRLSLLATLAAAMLLAWPSPSEAQLRIDHIRRKQATGGIYAPGGATSSLNGPAVGHAPRYNYGTGYYGRSYPFGHHRFGPFGFRDASGYYLGSAAAYGPTPLPFSPYVAPYVGAPIGAPYGLPYSPYDPYGFGQPGVNVNIGPTIVAPPAVGVPLATPSPTDPRPLLPLPQDTITSTLPGTESMTTPLNSPGAVERMKEIVTGRRSLQTDDWLGDAPVDPRFRPLLEARPGASTPEQQARSLQDEQLADRQFAERNYIRAYARYKKAIEAAPDRAEARLKYVAALAAASRYDQAVEELDRLLRFAPEFAREFIALDQIFVDDPIGKMQMKNRVAEWTAKAPGEASRLFLLGGLMYFDTDVERARQLLRSAERFAPGRYAIGPLLDAVPDGIVAGDVSTPVEAFPAAGGMTVTPRSPSDPLSPTPDESQPSLPGEIETSDGSLGDEPILPTDPIEPTPALP